ncbi:MAG: nuclease-related domain-containing protein [Candidatus Competibacteraceae bacterium]
MPADITLEEVWKLFRETDQKFRDTDRKLAQLETIVARTSRNVDDLTGKWGKFLEGIVAPACKTLFADRNIPVHKVLQRVQAEYSGRTMEIDILVVNEGYVVLVEVKSTLKVDDVRDHLKRLTQFREFFPEYADKQVLGAVAGIVIEDQADRFAYREGLFVIGQAGDTVRILNDRQFQPKSW